MALLFMKLGVLLSAMLVENLKAKEVARCKPFMQ
jgi:hypothetical protein